MIVPILVHLFQLQKFKKIAFTNVAFLKKIEQQTRKSSVIKKWIILTTRLLLLSCLILAFSQPYFTSKNEAKKVNENWLYLDNSISLNSKGEKGDLLQVYSQEILKNFKQDSKISLLTNTNFYKEIGKNELDQVLKNLEYSPKNKSLQNILLNFDKKKENKTNSLYEIFLISDFQNIEKNNFTNVNSNLYLISARAQTKNNISIDSLQIKEQTSLSLTIEVYITNHGNNKTTLPFSILINKKLNNKKVISVNEKESKSIEFTFQKSPYILGEIQLDFQDTFLFDNRFYFSLDFRSKIKVFSIGEKSTYLSKIFTENEFEFTSSNLSSIDFNEIPNQNFIILNEIKTIPNSLKSILEKFVKNGGNLLIIPSEEININSYNRLISGFGVGKIQNSVSDSIQITKIAYDHLVFSDVFSKKVQNFEYPSVYSRYISSFQGNQILTYANNKPFLEELSLANGKFFWFSAALNKNNSNFTRSPLIVPTLYNLAYQSLSIFKPYYFAGSEFQISVPVKLSQDEILEVSRDNKRFIPLQQAKFNKVNISLSDNIQKSGFYSILRKNDTLQQIAINYHSSESSHKYLDVNALNKRNSNIIIMDSVSQLFQEIEEKNKVQSLWKLFLALAIVSLLLEILILKFFKA